MRKNIDITESTLKKLKLLSVFEEISVKKLMEKAIEYYIKIKEEERIDSLTDEEKEDLGLLSLMMQSDYKDLANKNEVETFLRKHGS